MADALKVYPAYFKGDDALLVDETFVKIWAVKGVSRTQVINEIFKYGLDRMLDGDEELKEKVDRSSWSVAKKWQEKTDQVIRNEKLRFIYEQSTLSEFVDFCEENGIDHETFLREYEFTVPMTRTKSEAIAQWMEQLLSNGDEYSSEDIRETAKLDKVVGNDADWNLMKSIASKEGYSKGGRRGYWRKLQS